MRIRLATVVMLISSVAVRAAEEGAIPIAEVKHSGPVDFAAEVLPVLRRNCISCHNATQAKAKLVLETPQTIAKGGANGPVVVAGKADESMMLLVAAHESKPIMPPLENDRKAVALTPKELGLLKLWINEGAKGDVGAAAKVNWQPLPAGMNAVYAAAITADGAYAAASRGNRVFVYSVPGKREVARLSDPALVAEGDKKQGVADLDVIQSLAFSPDGTRLVSGAYRSVKIWQRPQNVQRGVWTGVESKSMSLAMAADGKRAAIGEENGKIRLFEVATGTLAATLEGHSGAVTGLSFSADGLRLASGSQDKTVRIWDLAASRATGLLDTGLPVNAVLLVNEDQQLATGGGDPKLRIWSLPASLDVPAEPVKPLKELEAHSGAIQRLVSLDAKGIEIVSLAANDNGAKRWNLTSFAQVRSFDGDAEARGFAMKQDGTRAVLACANGNLKLWDANNGQQFPDMRVDTRQVQRADNIDLAINLQRRRIENAKRDLEEANAELKREQDNIPKVTEARKQAETLLAQKTEAAVKPVAERDQADKELAAAEPAFAAAQEARKAAETADDAAKNAAQQALDQAQQKFEQAKERARSTKEPAVRAVAEKETAERNFKQLSRQLEQTAETLKKAQAAVAPAEAAIKQEEETLKQIEATLPPAREVANKPLPPHRALAMSPDGGLYAVAGEDGVVRMFSTANSQLAEVFEGHKGPVNLLAFTADGGLLSIGEDKSIIVWEVEPAWMLERTIGKPESAEFIDRVTALAFSPDGSLLATGGGEPSRSGEVKLWNATSGALVRAFPEPHSDTVLGLEFSPDGKYLATASADRFVKVFDVASGERIRAYEGHTGHATGVSWRADGRLLASSGAEGATKIWDFRSGEQRGSFIGWGREVTSLQFFGVEDKIIASTADAGVRLKRTDGGEERSWGDAARYHFLTRASHGGRLILAASDDGKLTVFSAQDNQPVAEFAAP